MKLKMAADQVLKRFSGKIVKEDAFYEAPRVSQHIKLPMQIFDCHLQRIGLEPLWLYHNPPKNEKAGPSRDGLSKTNWLFGIGLDDH